MISLSIERILLKRRAMDGLAKITVHFLGSNGNTTGGLFFTWAHFELSEGYSL